MYKFVWCCKQSVVNCELSHKLLSIHYWGWQRRNCLWLLDFERICIRSTANGIDGIMHSIDCYISGSILDRYPNNRARKFATTGCGGRCWRRLQCYFLSKTSPNRILVPNFIFIDISDDVKLSLLTSYPCISVFCLRSLLTF